MASSERAPVAPAAVTVEELSDRAAIRALAPQWEALRGEVAHAGGTRGPFLSPTWFAVYAASLTGRDSGRRLRLLVAHRAGTLAGVLPLVAEERRLAGMPARVLRSLSDDHSQRFDALLSRDRADEVARAFVQHLRADASWDVLELRDALSEGGTTGVDALQRAAEALGHEHGRWDAMVSPYLSLPARAEELDGLLDAKFRSNLRRRRKKLEKEVGPVALERVPNQAPAAVLDAALDEGLRLEAAGWKGARGTAIACDPQLTARYRALAHAFAAEDKLALFFLTVGGARKAFHFALVEDGVYYLFKPGYDPALANYGLGHLLVDAVCRELIPAGVRELDFLGDDMPWKREWTDRARAHAWRYVFADGVRGRALAAWKLRLAPRLKQLVSALRR